MTKLNLKVINEKMNNIRIKSFGVGQWKTNKTYFIGFLVVINLIQIKVETWWECYLIYKVHYPQR